MKPQFLIPTVLSGAVKYLFNDSFNDTLAAGAVNGTAAAPGPGTRAVVDTGSDLSLSGGNMVLADRAGNGDPGLWLDAVTRAAGVFVVGQVNLGHAGNGFSIGFDTNTAGSGVEIVKLISSTLRDPGSATVISKVLVAGRDYYFAIVLKSTGSYIFVKETTQFSNWTMLWHGTEDSTATLYPQFGAQSAHDSLTNTSSFLRVPEATWLPEPLAYDTFTDDNSTSLDAHASNTTGPDSQGCTSRSWTEGSGDWDIQSNKANPDGAATAVVDVSEADVVIDSVVSVIHNDGLLMRYTDENTHWHLRLSDDDNEIQIWENDTGWTDRASAALAITETDYDLRAICDGQTIDGFVDGGNKATYGSAALNETATKHGIKASNTATGFDNFTIFARDSGYSQLDLYTR